jgi:hypothetical protein
MTLDEILAIGLFCMRTGDKIDFGVETSYLLHCYFRIFPYLRKVRDRNARANLLSEYDSGGSSYTTISTGDEHRFTLEPSSPVSKSRDLFAVTCFPLPLSSPSLGLPWSSQI